MYAHIHLRAMRQASRQGTYLRGRHPGDRGLEAVLWVRDGAPDGAGHSVEHQEQGGGHAESGLRDELKIVQGFRVDVSTLLVHPVLTPPPAGVGTR
jgi:hypothetical protein